MAILMVIGAPSLYIFGLLFILPAMLHVKREVSLIAASLVAIYTYEGAWAAVAHVALVYAAASRLPVLREPEGHGWALGPPFVAHDKGPGGWPRRPRSGHVAQ